jgi:hypothetical protein
MPQPHTVSVDPVLGTCTPDSITHTQAHGQNVPIFFVIDPNPGNAWSWSRGTPNPIVVQAPSEKFSGGAHPSSGNGKDKVTVVNRNLPEDAGTYKYTVTVVDDNTGRISTIDPQIVNAAE